MPGFSNILGQEAVKDHLKKAIEYHKVSHAYILTGEKGMGKKNAGQCLRFVPSL